MKIFTKKQFEDLMNAYPDGGIVFAEYSSDILAGELMVTDGDFGATCVIPSNGEVWSFDWNLEEYSEDEEFAVFDNDDVLQMIQTLTKGLKIKLKAWFEDNENSD